MNITKLLQKIEIPLEYRNKTAFLFEIIDDSFLQLGLEPETVVLVDNSKEFTTNKPIAFDCGNEKFIGMPEIIIEDLFQLKNDSNLGPEKLFSKNEIEVIGQIKGYFRYNDGEAKMIFERI